MTSSESFHGLDRLSIVIVNDAKSAREFAQSWVQASKIRAEWHLREAVLSLEKIDAIDVTYSRCNIDLREAIGVLRLAYFELTGKAVV